MATASSPPDRRPVIVVVGQTPPPVGGQAVMIQALLDAELPAVSVRHVRMNFAGSLSEHGSWRLGKALHAFSVVGRILRARFWDGASLLYYPPSGNGRLPVFRDALVLGTTRHFFPRVVYHFHASGLSATLDHFTPWERRVVRWAFGRPTAALTISESAPNEGVALGAQRAYVVPNGVADPPPPAEQVLRACPPVLLFLGLVSRGKGASRLIAMSHALAAGGLDHQLWLVGECESPDYQVELTDEIRAAGAESRIRLPGVLTGEAKWDVLRQASVFCFPTSFHSETSPVVILEAMAAGLPVVASRWRGIPDLIDDGVTGFLVEVDDEDALVRSVATLLTDPARRERMGQAGRDRYLDRFTLATFQQRMATVLKDVLDA